MHSSMYQKNIKSLVLYSGKYHSFSDDKAHAALIKAINSDVLYNDYNTFVVDEGAEDRLTFMNYFNKSTSTIFFRNICDLYLNGSNIRLNNIITTVNLFDPKYSKQLNMLLPLVDSNDSRIVFI